MTMMLGGPMFQRIEDEWRVSSLGREGGHYNIYASKPGMGLDFLRKIFPEGEANEMNFVLFSTSGVHGTYTTIEEVEHSLKKYGDREFSDDEDLPEDWHGGDVTFLLVQPRIVGMTYGNLEPKTPEDFAFLKKLRASSWEWAAKIGAPEKPERKPRKSKPKPRD